MLVKLLELKFGQLPEEMIQRVRGASIEDLDRWVERVITAASLKEVLAD